MSIVSRRTLIGPALLLLAVAILYPAYWYYAAGQAEEQLARWVSVFRAKGYDIRHSSIRVDGFPGVVRLTIEKPSLRTPDKSAKWQGAAAVLAMQPWDWWRYRVEFPEHHSVEFTHPELGAPVTAVPEKTLVLLHLHRNGRLAEGEARIASLRVSGGGKGEVATVGETWLKVAQPETADAGAGGTVLSLSTALENLRIPSAADGPLGGVLQRVQFVGDVKGALPRDITREGVDEWRRAGGLVESSWLNLVWGPFDLRGRGSLGLDERHRPLAAVTTDIRGYTETLDALERARLMQRTAAAALRIALNVLAKPSPADGVKVLSVPLTARDGQLRVGPFQLFRLLPLSLPSRSG